MNVEKGAVYGLVGPNGAGKSTLIRHITGVMRQDAGEVFIDGEPVYENARIKGHMAYIPDDMFYFLQSDTINMMHYYKGMYPNFDEKQFYRMQEFSRVVGMDLCPRHFLWLSLSQLSLSHSKANCLHNRLRLFAIRDQRHPYIVL